MDFSRIDKVQDKLEFLFQFINSLKEENLELKRKVYSLELNLQQARMATGADDMKSKYSNLVEERDRLVMERELIRNKVKIMIEQFDSSEKGEE